MPTEKSKISGKVVSYNKSLSHLRCLKCIARGASYLIGFLTSAICVLMFDMIQLITTENLLQIKPKSWYCVLFISFSPFSFVIFISVLLIAAGVIDNGPIVV